MNGLTFLDPGMLRHEMMLQEAVAIPDGTGGHDEEWREVAVVFALIEPIRGNSFFAAGQRHEAVTHKVTLRHRDDVKSGMRFLRLGRALMITDLHDPDESGRYLVANVREEVR
ncbi:phage head closure protein [Nitratireductor basaltis]|uniref:Phage head-tail adaptor n=1 Tax=Nitratireductor basaltis TaxID=472175 RepID=A0A084UCG6_9HYPH|nr:phage head closure protein [Nitratireductor basaltis]KFB10652.1 Phage head-tail adaptor [Nitratireductor basaltis]